MQTQRGGVILYVLRLHVSRTKEPEKKLNRNALLTYLLERTWKASMQKFMMRIDRKLR